MKKKNIFNLKFCFLLFVTFCFAVSCTKVDKGYISPTMAYAVNQFTAIQGRIAHSYTLVSDGSTTPWTVKLIHVYDASGNLVDDIFINKTYPMAVWSSAYDSKTDVTFAKIMAKRTTANLHPIELNEHSGMIQTTPATLYIPQGTYSFDLDVTNVVGTMHLKKIISLVLTTGAQVETSPVTGAYSIGRLLANSPTGATNGTISSFNGNNNPFVIEKITRVADTPNMITFKLYDKNGKPFSPKANEVMKRPASGLNPNPPFLQNLQDYAPDTFVATDSAMSLRYPLVPFPIASLGNGYNMYYRIPTAFAHIDSTSAWSSNAAGGYYAGVADSHFKGYLKDGLYDYSFRIPLRIQVPGNYLITLKFLNVTHR